MRIAVMQPYFFPYLGYFQLITAVDKFVLYDDVNFINRGWINRNNILIGGKASLITIPLKAASQNKKICDIAVTDDMKQLDALLKTIYLNYRKAPFFDPVYALLSTLFSNAERYVSISSLCFESIRLVCDYLQIKTVIEPTSVIYNNGQLKAQERILDICQKENASVYINPIGGIELYDDSFFRSHGIELYFLRMIAEPYPQNIDNFVPYLSMLDCLMFNDKQSVSNLLGKYTLLKADKVNIE